ncbi:hypothetical protein ACS2VC_27410, partial [Bacillus cereus group sp. BC241]
EVVISKRNDQYVLVLPSWLGQTCTLPTEISDLAVDVIDVYSTRDLVLVFPSIEAVINFQPDYERLKQLNEYHALIVTASYGKSGY